MNKFYDEKNKTIFCPEDGAVAKSLSDLKLLQNLIVETNDDENENDEEKNNFDHSANNVVNSYNLELFHTS